MGGRSEVEGGLYHTLKQRKSHCVPMKYKASHSESQYGFWYQFNTMCSFITVELLNTGHFETSNVLHNFTVIERFSSLEVRLYYHDTVWTKKIVLYR